MGERDELQELRASLSRLLAEADQISRRLRQLELQELEGRARERLEGTSSIEPIRAPGPPPLPPTAAKAVAMNRQEPAELPPLTEAPAPTSVSPIRQPLPPPPPPRPPRDRGPGWEIRLGTYWIPRIGIGLVTLAVVFALTLAMNKWGPPMRVGLGYGVCAVLLALGWRLDKRYPNYARILFSGGFALSYFVTFAAHYVPFAKVIESTPVALTLLAFVVGIWAAAAQVRKSRLLGALVTILGHLTVLLAIQGPGGIGKYGSLGVVVLSAGSAFFLLRNGWYYIAALGLAGAYGNHALWMYTTTGADSAFNFWANIGLLAAHYLLYSLAEYFSPPAIRERIPLAFRTAFVTANTAALFGFGTLVVEHYTYSHGHQDLFRFAVSGVLFLLALGYWARRDLLHNAYFTKAVTALTLGLAVRYTGDTLTAWLAVETVVLLISARQSGLTVTRVLALLVGAAGFLYGLTQGMSGSPIAYEDPGYAQASVKALITVASFYAASVIYELTDWTNRSPKWSRIPNDLVDLFWQFDFAEAPASSKLQKMGDGLLYPVLYTLFGSVLLFIHGQLLTHEGHWCVLLAGNAVALFVLAAAAGSRTFDLASLVWLGVGAVVGTYEIGTVSSMPVWADISVAVLLGAVALGVERAVNGRFHALEFHRQPWTAYFAYPVVSWIVAAICIDRLVLTVEFASLTSVAVLLAVLFLWLHPRAMAYSSTIVFLIAVAHWYFMRESAPEVSWRVSGLLLMATLLVADRFYVFAARRSGVEPAGFAAIGMAWCVAMGYAQLTADPEWHAFRWAVVACGFLGYGLAYRSLLAGALGVISALTASGHHTFISLDETQPQTAMTLGFLALVAFWAVCERLGTRVPSRGAISSTWITVPPVAMATGLMIVLLYCTPQFASFYLTVSWAVLGVGLFGWAMLIGQKYYRYAALSVLGLAVIRAMIVDTRNLETIYKVLALGVLGGVLLGVGYGYFKWRERVQGGEGSPPDEPMV
ncbi:MAG: hypothetical protein AMXMBFR84_11660 [Candidatus Hydrogenedentota bacterium]